MKLSLSFALILIVIVGLVAIVSVDLLDIKSTNAVVYHVDSVSTSDVASSAFVNNNLPYALPTVSHMETPVTVRGLYLSAWGAGDAKLSKSVIDIITNNRLNSVVIDLKDYTGYIAFKLDQGASTSDKYVSLYNYNNDSKKIADIKALIQRLHDKNIYIIARIAVFQDPHMPKVMNQWAIKDKSGNTWKDKKGLAWINPSEREYWKYIEGLSIYAHDIGFDEINLDYIRFPTDGDIGNMDLGLGSSTKSETIDEFYRYMGDALYGIVPVSADLFGLTTVADDDMGIGQKIESGLVNFNFVAPMIYPSHYGADFKGIHNPDASPYQTILETMKAARIKVVRLATDTDMSDDYYWSKMRPWIQDFSIHSTYGVKEVEAQIRALNELGIDSYLIWNASNRYTKGVKY